MWCYEGMTTLLGKFSPCRSLVGGVGSSHLVWLQCNLVTVSHALFLLRLPPCLVLADSVRLCEFPFELCEMNSVFSYNSCVWSPGFCPALSQAVPVDYVQSCLLVGRVGLQSTL